MRGNRYDRDLAFSRTVAPEYAVSARGLILGVGLEHFLLVIVRVIQGAVIVSFKPWMPRVTLQIFNALIDLLEKPLDLRSFGLLILFSIF